MRDRIIEEINKCGLEEVANRFFPIGNDSIAWRKKNNEPVNGDFDRLMQHWRELTIIRNCMLGSVRAVRTTELVADKLLRQIEKYPEIEKHLIERL